MKTGEGELRPEAEYEIQIGTGGDGFRRRWKGELGKEQQKGMATEVIVGEGN